MNKYKCKGDGFKCDTVCNSGYTFSFWFWHGPPPDLDNKYKNLDLSLTARRVMWLAKRLPNQWSFTRTTFSTLKSCSLPSTWRNALHMVLCGQMDVDSLPASSRRRQKNLKMAELMRGTTKAARLTGSASAQTCSPCCCTTQSRYIFCQLWHRR